MTIFHDLCPQNKHASLIHFRNAALICVRPFAITARRGFILFALNLKMYACCLDVPDNFPPHVSSK